MFHVVFISNCTCRSGPIDQRRGMLIPELNIFPIASISIFSRSVLCYFHLQIVTCTSETLRVFSCVILLPITKSQLFNNFLVSCCFHLQIVACTSEPVDQRRGMLTTELNILQIASISIFSRSISCYFHLQIIACTSETVQK